MKLRSVDKWNDTVDDYTLVLQVWSGNQWVDVPSVDEDDQVPHELGNADTFLDTDDV